MIPIYGECNGDFSPSTISLPPVSRAEIPAIISRVSSRRIAIVGLLAPILFVLWYTIAANYDYAALAGTYLFRAADESCELHLRADQTFAEELRRSGQTQRAEGQWRRYGEAHVSFSREFIPLQSEELNGSGEAHGQFEKTLGVFPKLVLAPLPGGPTLQKRWFR